MKRNDVIWIVWSLIATALLCEANLYGQTPARENFNFVFENNFEDDQLGTYVTKEYEEDWNLPSGYYIREQNHIDILKDEDPSRNKVMRGYYAKGTYLPANHGINWRSYLKTPCEELYFSYDIKFKPGFVWKLGGKIPGLVGGEVVEGDNQPIDAGFSARIMWKQDGDFVMYVYHQDQQQRYGNSWWFENFKCTSGRWYNVTLRVVLNTITNGVAANDGILEGFIDGKLIFQKTDLKYRSLERIKIDNMYMSSFFGGSDSTWAAARDEWINFDNFVSYTYSNSATNVPKGNVASSKSKLLLHPVHDFSNVSVTPITPLTPTAPSAFNFAEKSKSVIMLKWTDNSSNEQGFRLYRSMSSTDGFVEIANLPANVTNYTDLSLQPVTTYYYKLLAYNQDGNSDYSPVLAVTTNLLDLPAAPSMLAVTGHTPSSISLGWKDNSWWEQGFRLYRSTNATDGFVEVGTIPANTLTYTDNSLLASTTYYYKMIAYNQDGYSAYTSVLEAATADLQMPSTPSGLFASSVEYNYVVLQWKDNADNEDGYELERSGPNDISIKSIIALSANAITYNDTGLVMNSTYQYRIRTKNEDGNSAWSDNLDVITPKLTVNPNTSLIPNTAPVIYNQQFSVFESSFSDNFIGRIVASDEDIDQVISFSITSGNTGGMFIINSQTGDLKTSTDKIFGPGTFTYEIVVKVTDNGNESKSTSARITVQLNGKSTVVYIDPNNESDNLANGSLEHPFSSWEDVKWKEGNTYLQKRSTSTTINKIIIGANKVTIGAYGEGELPVIYSETNTYMLSGFEKSGIKIRDLNLQATNAVSCIYFLGNSGDSIIIECCKLTANANAIKVVDDITLVAKYNTITCNLDGIFSTAFSNVIFYNIFKGCNTAVNVSGNSSKASIYNNVFFDNEKSLSVSYAELTLYNNIFYMITPGQMALYQKSGVIQSDHNIFYPEQAGFVSIDNMSFNNLQELQKSLKIDMNSFSSDPLFVDMYNENFSIAAMSPAINAGIDLKLGIDFNGSKVPLFGGTDIGINEFTGPTLLSRKPKEESVMTLYPNPCSGQVSIKAEIKQDMLQLYSGYNQLEIQVVDLSGNTVFTEHIENTSNSTIQDNLDLSAISNGLYFVVLHIADKVLKEKLLITK